MAESVMFITPTFSEEDFPSREKQEQQNRLTTYINYLVSLSEYLDSATLNDWKPYREMTKSKTFMSIQGGNCKDFERVARNLRNAWITEIQAEMAAENDEFVAYSNHWLPVQTYYSVYLALRSLFRCKGELVGESHAAHLKRAAQEISQKPDLFPYPWKMICTGDPERNPKYQYWPNNVARSSVSTLSYRDRDDYFNFLGTFLKTTRKKQLERKNDLWKVKNNKKRVSPQAKKSHIKQLAPTTLFDCLYRLRIRSNYLDADSFLESLGSAGKAKEFNEALRTITWHTLFLLEILITKHIRKKKYEEILQSFQKVDRGNYSEKLSTLRFETFKSFW